MTVLPEATFRSLSSKKPALQDVTRWLKVYGANGIEIPYMGITELNIDLLGVQLGGVGVLVSMMTTETSSQPISLLGSNVLREVWEALRENYGESYLQNLQGTGDTVWADALFAYEVAETTKPWTGLFCPSCQVLHSTVQP